MKREVRRQVSTSAATLHKGPAHAVTYIRVEGPRYSQFWNVSPSKEI